MFDSIKDNLSEVGLMIADQRERYSLSIKELSTKLRLRYDVLEKIESGDFELIDRRVNIIGYISMICKEINLNQKLILSKLGFSEDALLGKGVVKKVTDEMDVFSYSDLKKENKKWLSFNIGGIKRVNNDKVGRIAIVIILILILIKLT